jgi:hypothetical protein
MFVNQFLKFLFLLDGGSILSYNALLCLNALRDGGLCACWSGVGKWRVW